VGELPGEPHTTIAASTKDLLCALDPVIRG
jgi:hypothetical protein